MRRRISPIIDTVKSSLRRAMVIALVVGTALLMINHGDHLASEPVCAHFYLKLCGVYAVPFTVSMVSAVLAARAPPGA